MENFNTNAEKRDSFGFSTIFHIEETSSKGISSSKIEEKITKSIIRNSTLISTINNEKGDSKNNPEEEIYHNIDEYNRKKSISFDIFYKNIEKLQEKEKFSKNHEKELRERIFSDVTSFN